MRLSTVTQIPSSLATAVMGRWKKRVSSARSMCVASRAPPRVMVAGGRSKAGRRRGRRGWQRRGQQRQRQAAQSERRRRVRSEEEGEARRERKRGAQAHTRALRLSLSRRDAAEQQRLSEAPNGHVSAGNQPLVVGRPAASCSVLRLANLLLRRHRPRLRDAPRPRDPREKRVLDHLRGTVLPIPALGPWSARVQTADARHRRRATVERPRSAASERDRERSQSATLYGVSRYVSVGLYGT